MTQLSGQTIRKLCQQYTRLETPIEQTFIDRVLNRQRYNGQIVKQIPMIAPFEPEKKISNGKSYGLSSASYDCRVKEDVVLGPNGSDTCCALVHTIERFCIPDNVVGYVCDKSSYARVFVSAFNTLFDPGFSGKTADDENPVDPYADAVIELVNMGKHPVEIKAGDPICQFAFHFLDEPAEKPYRGKYSAQRGAQPAIYETPSQKGQ